VLTRFGEWRADAWVGQPVEIDTGIFDDQRIEETTFWGGYVTGPLPFIPGLNADFYYLGLSRENAKFARGRADEFRHSLGTRLFGKQNSLDWNFEFVGQFGSFGDDDSFAWTAASDTGWTFADAPARPRVFLHADIASGDHGGSDLGTFNPLFPRGAYFGELALIGPANHVDVHPELDLALSRNATLALDWDCFWRESTHDAIYRIAGTPIVSGAANDDRYVGSQGSVEIAWQLDRHVEIVGNYSHFFAGPFLRDASRDDVNFLALWLSLRI